MTDSHEPVEQLYQQRKRQHKASRQTRDYVLSKANSQAGAKLPGLNLWNWTLGISLCAGIILLFSFVGNVQQQLQNPPQQVQTIHIHSLHEEQDPLLASVDELKQRTRIEKEQNYATYMKSQALLDAHHSNNARLVSVDSGWQIETCEQQLIVLTQELVTQMKHLKMLEQSLKKGDQIEIAFDQSGRILTIKGRPAGASC